LVIREELPDTGDYYVRGYQNIMVCAVLKHKILALMELRIDMEPKAFCQVQDWIWNSAYVSPPARAFCIQ